MPRGIREGDHVTIARPDRLRPELLGREGTAVLVGTESVLVDLEGGDRVVLLKSSLDRRIEFAREFGSEAAPDVTAANLAVARMNTAIEAAIARAKATPSSAVELLEELLPELVALVGLTGVLPAPAVPIVERIAERLAQEAAK